MSDHDPHDLLGFTVSFMKLTEAVDRVKATVESIQLPASLCHVCKTPTVLDPEAREFYCRTCLWKTRRLEADLVALQKEREAWKLRTETFEAELAARPLPDPEGEYSEEAEELEGARRDLSLCMADTPHLYRTNPGRKGCGEENGIFQSNCVRCCYERVKKYGVVEKLADVVARIEANLSNRWVCGGDPTAVIMDELKKK